MTSPGADDLWFLPLGGCGEIGMNLNLYGHNGQWLMVDCGITFPDNIAPDGNGAKQIVTADPSFIAARRSQLCGLVITHAHEDHIGAVPLLWSQLRCPIYTTPFTAEVLRRKLMELDGLGEVEIITVPVNGRCSIGHFDIQWIPLTHSIPEPQALLIKTAAGTVFHTADWKLDAEPVVGAKVDPQRYRDLAHHKVAAMVCDSTNAAVAGHSISEGALYGGLKKVIAAVEGRVVVSCFGSNVARMQTIVKVAQETGRYAALLGRSLHNMRRASLATGYWPEALSLVNASHLGYLPREEVLAIATGSQGEEGAALSQLALGVHRDLELQAGDAVVFSSRVIPGNEKAITTLVERLRGRGVTVVFAEDCDPPIHASGHPCQDELRLMYQWVKPALAIPVHGESSHMEANAAMAKDVGIESVLIGENGDLFKIRPTPSLHKRFTASGRLLFERR